MRVRVPSNLALRLRLTLHRQNWLIWVGVALLVCAATLRWIAQPWLEKRNSETIQAIQGSLAQRNTSSVPGHALSRAELATQRAQAFFKMLGDEHSFEQNLSSLLTYAKDAGLTVAEANYDHATAPKAGMTLEGVALPLTGTYSSLRTFCETTLQHLPFASLDSVQFKRSSVAADAVEAKLHLTLYLRNGPSTTPVTTSSDSIATSQPSLADVQHATAEAP
ncbi:hypothetical protein [Ralstonia sp. Ralssp110]|uniref:hypothetical protein n=1 Tax=Ralstonia sp. Ralssp110 TaxID=3243004 RepID=UPI0039B4B985